ncbi:MAG: hypothetical protein RLT87_10260 [Gammaproteobacteria bacterium]
MKTSCAFVAGLPQMDIYTLREDFMLANSLENHWRILAGSVGKKPSDWYDSSGDRMYAAVIYTDTEFDLDDPIQEDDEVTGETEFVAVRKPQSLSLTRYLVNDKVKAKATILSVFIKRQQRGSNKKFSKVRGLWSEDDFNGDLIDDLLDRHQAVKSVEDRGGIANRHRVNRLVDFNLADFMYFKNYVRLAKVAEWNDTRDRAEVINFKRETFYFGNVDDGDLIETFVHRDGNRMQTTHHVEGGERFFVSLAKTREVKFNKR